MYGLERLRVQRVVFKLYIKPTDVKTPPIEVTVNMPVDMSLGKLMAVMTAAAITNEKIRRKLEKESEYAHQLFLETVKKLEQEEGEEKPTAATLEDVHSATSIEVDYTGSTTASPSTRDVDKPTAPD